MPTRKDEPWLNVALLPRDTELPYIGEKKLFVPDIYLFISRQPAIKRIVLPLPFQVSSLLLPRLNIFPLPKKMTNAVTGFCRRVFLAARVPVPALRVQLPQPIRRQRWVQERIQRRKARHQKCFLCTHFPHLVPFMTPDQGHALYASEQRCHGHALRMARQRREVKLTEKQQVKDDKQREKLLRERSSIPPKHLSSVSPKGSFDFHPRVDPDGGAGTSSQGLKSVDQTVNGIRDTVHDLPFDSGLRPLAGSVSRSTHSSRSWRQIIKTSFKRKPSTATFGSTVLSLPAPPSSLTWTTDTVRPTVPSSDPAPLPDSDVERRSGYGGWLHALRRDKKGKQKKQQLQSLAIESLEPIEEAIQSNYSRCYDRDENSLQADERSQSGTEDLKHTRRMNYFDHLLAKRTVKAPLNKGKGRAREYDSESDEGSTGSHSLWDDGRFEEESPARLDFNLGYERETECHVGVTGSKQQSRPLHRSSTQESFASTTTRIPFPSIDLMLDSQNQKEQQEEHIRSLLVFRQERQVQEEAELRQRQLLGERPHAIEYIEYLEDEPTEDLDSNHGTESLWADFDSDRQQHQHQQPNPVAQVVIEPETETAVSTSKEV